MAIIPAEFTSSAAPKADGSPILESANCQEGSEIFGRTLRELFGSSDEVSSSAITGECARRGLDDGSLPKVPLEQSAEDPLETVVNVSISIGDMVPKEIDVLILQMAEVGRAANIKAGDGVDIELERLLQSNLIGLSKAANLTLASGSEGMTRTSEEVKPSVEAIDRLTASSSLSGVRADVLGGRLRPTDASNRVIQTEPQQFATGVTTHISVLKRLGGGEAKLNLHPAELGRMSISVSTEGNETRVAFVVETSQARQAVEAALPRLRDMLENAGLSLSDSDVSEQRNSQADSGDEGPGSSRGDSTSPGGDDVSATTVLSLTVDPDRLVDTYI